MGTSADPVGTELVPSLARPGGNVTGLSTLGSDLSGKRLELLKEVVPGVARIAVLSNPTNQSVPALLRETKIAAQSLGVQVQFLEARTPDELNKAIRSYQGKVPSALMVVPDPMLFSLSAQAAFGSRGRESLADDSRVGRVRWGGWSHVLWPEFSRYVPACRGLMWTKS